MATSYSAFISIDGKTALGAASFVGSEEISRVPEYLLELHEVTYKVEDFLGKPAEITLPVISDTAVEPRTPVSSKSLPASSDLVAFCLEPRATTALLCSMS